MNPRTRLPLFLLLLAASCSHDARPEPAAADDIDAALATITPGSIKSHITFLGDDLLEGRSPGTRGYDVAAKYVAATLEGLGLEPAGERGSFFQRVPLQETVTDSTRTEVVIQGERLEPLVYGRDFVTTGNPFDEVATVSAPLAFVGYGVDAPEQQLTDYKNIDVKGKVVVALFDAPKRFPSTARAYYASTLVKLQTAASHGAVGFLQIASPGLFKIYPWELLAADARRRLNWVDGQGQPADAFRALRVTGWVHEAAAERLFRGSSVQATDIFRRHDAGEPIEATDLKTAIRARIQSAHRRFDSSNVAAIYRGDERPDQVVVYTAHLDHLGIGTPINNDNIYNGVVDNASGVAGMLAVARAFTALPKRPRRSVMFLAVTAEELGLIGSDYFARNPTVPREALVANVNIDGAAVLYDFADVVAFGFEHSTISTSVQRAAERLQLQITPDPFPEQVYFVRSDHYSFVKQGIPAIFASDGLKAIDKTVDGKAVVDAWNATRYHRPNDDLQQPLNFTAAGKGGKVQFLIGYYLATDRDPPQWNEGDFFGQRFGRKRSPR